MIPLSDLNPRRRFPIVTYLLILVNVGLFIWEQSHSDEALQTLLMQLVVVPSNVVADPFSLETVLDFVRSMFFHGGWAHLLGNMLYLYLFGDNVEDRMGIPLYLFVYFVSGFAASIAQIAIEPNSSIPMLGASGAIAGVLGSYLIMFPGVKVRGIVPLGIFVRFMELPAWIVLGLWFVLQLFNGLISIGVETSVSGGVAFFAHIGGFVAGIVLTLLFLVVVPQPSREQRREMLYERAQRYRY